MAHAIAVREAREDANFDGPGVRFFRVEEEKTPALSPAAVEPIKCIAYEVNGSICGVSPANHLDMERGGYVCDAHKKGSS